MREREREREGGREREGEGGRARGSETDNGMRERKGGSIVFKYLKSQC